MFGNQSDCKISISVHHRFVNVFGAFNIRSVAIGNPERHVRKASHRGSKQQQRSLYYCLFAPHTYIFVLRAHPVRGESHNQRNTTGEVATVVRSLVKTSDTSSGATPSVFPLDLVFCISSSVLVVFQSYLVFQCFFTAISCLFMSELNVITVLLVQFCVIVLLLQL